MSERAFGTPYDRYAEIYDRLGQRHFAERTAAALLDHLAARDVRPQRVLDLACGTGAASLIFAAAGCEVIGLDRSPTMLEGGRRVAASRGLTIDYIEGDMRDLAAAGITGPFDLVSCFYDSINYLLDDDDLTRTFQGVASVLASSGLFVFDVNTRRKLRLWEQSAFVAIDDDDLFGVYQASYDEERRLSPLRATFFSATAEGQWERFDEEHVERGWTIEELSGALEGAGLTPDEVMEIPNQGGAAAGTGSEASLRVLVLARPSGEGSVA